MLWGAGAIFVGSVFSLPLSPSFSALTFSFFVASCLKKKLLSFHIEFWNLSGFRPIQWTACWIPFNFRDGFHTFAPSVSVMNENEKRERKRERERKTILKPNSFSVVIEHFQHIPSLPNFLHQFWDFFFFISFLSIIVNWLNVWEFIMKKFGWCWLFEQLKEKMWLNGICFSVCSNCINKCGVSMRVYVCFVASIC